MRDEKGEGVNSGAMGGWDEMRRKITQKRRLRKRKNFGGETKGCTSQMGASKGRGGEQNRRAKKEQRATTRCVRCSPTGVRLQASGRNHRNFQIS